jgi:glycosyltransferase involved in cell wall biosynthesis
VSEVLLDVTRLIWRSWRGGLPTGVDRVCLAYLEQFGPRAQAVIQRKGLHLVLTRAASARLFDLLGAPPSDFRRRLVRLLAAAGPVALFGRVPEGALYLNIGHTGLDEPGLNEWIERHRLREIVFVHDLIPITHPETCRPGERDRHERRMRNALLGAAGVIGNSQATLDDLSDFAARTGLPMPPALAAWLGGIERHQATGTQPSGPPLFLALGTIEGRKNHLMLLRLWRRLFDRLGPNTPKLVIVGRRGWQADEVFRQLDDLGPLADHVTELSRCSDAEVSALMGKAKALLMSSQAEGYGLPVFEALAQGLPVIATDLPVYREVAADIPTYCSGDDVDAWEEAVLDFANDGPERRRQIARLPDFAPPTWAEHFERVEQWLSASGLAHREPS